MRLPVTRSGQKLALLGKICDVAAAGVDWIQLREKDLNAKELAALARQAISSIPRSCRVLINDRLDVARAVRAGGVHLGEESIPVQEAKRFVRERGMDKDFLIGASVHSLEGARSAERDGADYIVFGPIFATSSKEIYGKPQGLEKLADICSEISIPVFAIGGITAENARECYAQEVRGICAIGVFQKASDLATVVKQLRTSYQSS
jgi:thiamine-phosphate diphosphorylase